MTLFDDRAELFLPARKNDQFREGSVVKLAAGRTVACLVGLLLARHVATYAVIVQAATQHA